MSYSLPVVGVAILVNMVLLDFVCGVFVVKCPMEIDFVGFVNMAINISNDTDIKVVIQMYFILYQKIWCIIFNLSIYLNSGEML